MSFPATLLPVQRVRAGDVELAESDLPASERGPGAPVVFLHGLGGFLDNWVWTVGAARAAGRRALALDWPGFGRSEKPDSSYSPSYLAGSLRRYLDAKGIDRAVLVGNSLGGLVAQVFAGADADRVAGLVLVDPAGAGPLYGTFLRLGLATIDARLREGAWNRRFLRRLVPFVFHTRHPDLVELMRLWGKNDVTGARDPLFRRSMVRATRHLATARTLPVAADLQIPVAIAWGRHDRLVPLSQGQELAAAITGASLRVFEQSGHVPMLEEPQAFNGWLATVLRSMP